MAGRAFSPATVTIAAGGSVTFRNDDDRAHTVTAKDGAFNSGPIGEGGSWKRTFKQAGTFSYLCAIHPEMTGKVVVKGSGGSAPARRLPPTPKPKPTPTPTPTPAATTEGLEAEIHDFSFAPAELTVPVGSTVTWRNAGDAPHTVTASDGSFDSEMIAAGGSWARTFETAGTFTYVCAFHPQMEGVVEVTAGEVAAASRAAIDARRRWSPRLRRSHRHRPNPRPKRPPSRPRARASGASSWPASRSSDC